MATYTMRLSDALENIFNPVMDRHAYELEYGKFEVNGMKYGRLPILPDPDLVGLGSYPIFNEDYRPILNGKIIDNYFNREIGMETIDDWRLALRRKMDQIMPYYNQLYESELIDYDPLITMDIDSKGKNTGTGTEKVNGVSSSESTSDSDSRAVASETPQTMLSGSGDYATSSSDSTGKTTVDALNTQDSSSESNNENESENRVRGMQGIAPDLIMRYRNSLLNIDTMVINDLEDCFMLLLNNGDSYTRNGWYY